MELVDKEHKKAAAVAERAEEGDEEVPPREGLHENDGRTALHEVRIC
jgi:hypothetical protein